MRYTIVPSHFEVSDIASQDFSRTKFHGIGADERDEMVSDGMIECLDPARRVYRYTGRSIRVRGFSARHGTALEAMLNPRPGGIDNRELGRTMLSEIQRGAPAGATQGEGWRSNAVRQFRLDKYNPSLDEGQADADWRARVAAATEAAPA